MSCRAVHRRELLDTDHNPPVAGSSPARPTVTIQVKPSRREAVAEGGANLGRIIMRVAPPRRSPPALAPPAADPPPERRTAAR